ncbi:hypothetical protein ABGV42_17130 [Paenibacillus pabuli]
MNQNHRAVIKSGAGHNDVSCLPAMRPQIVHDLDELRPFSARTAQRQVKIIQLDEERC